MTLMGALQGVLARPERCNSNGDKAPGHTMVGTLVSSQDGGSWSGPQVGPANWPHAKQPGTLAPRGQGKSTLLSTEHARHGSTVNSALGGQHALQHGQ